MTDLTTWESFVNSIPAGGDIIEGEYTAEPDTLPTAVDLNRLLDILFPPDTSPAPDTATVPTLSPAYFRRKARRTKVDDPGGNRAMVVLALFVGFILLLCLWILFSFIASGG